MDGMELTPVKADAVDCLAMESLAGFPSDNLPAHLNEFDFVAAFTAQPSFLTKL